MSNDTILITAIDKSTERDAGTGFTVTSFMANGEPHTTAVVNAVVQNYNRPHHPEEMAAALESRHGEKVTLVCEGETMLGAKLIVAQEGKLFQGGRGIGLLPKGARSRGYRVNAEKVLDVIDGWDTAEAQRRVDAVRDTIPPLRKLTRERLLELPGEGEFDETLTLAVFGEWRMPDATAYDAVWLIGEYWPDADICDRGVLLIRPEVGFSEHGSVYGSQLLGRPVGEVAGFQPIGYREAVDLCDLPFDEAIGRLADRWAVRV